MRDRKDLFSDEDDGLDAGEDVSVTKGMVAAAEKTFCLANTLVSSTDTVVFTQKIFSEAESMFLVKKDLPGHEDDVLRPIDQWTDRSEVPLTSE